MRRLGINDPIFTYDDVQEWPDSEFRSLLGLGLLAESPPLQHVICDCPLQHLEKVTWTRKGEAVIPCRYEGTVVRIRRERLWSWKASPERLAQLLAENIAPRGQSNSSSVSRTSHLGRLWISGRFRDCFFAAVGPTVVASTVEAISQEWGTGFGIMFLPFVHHSRSAWTSKLPLIDLVGATTLGSGGVLLDVDYVSDQFPESPGARVQRKVPRIPVAPGASWSELQLVVEDDSLRISLRGPKQD